MRVLSTSYFTKYKKKDEDQSKNARACKNIGSPGFR